MPKLRLDSVRWRAVDGEIIALDLRTQAYFAVSRSGSPLWPLLEAGTDTATLASTLAAVAGIPKERAAEDVRAFLEDLSARDLLEP